MMDAYHNAKATNKIPNNMKTNVMLRNILDVTSMLRILS